VGRIWDGDNVAQEMLQRVRDEVASLQRLGHPPPTLAELRVSEAPSNDPMQIRQEEACWVSGISYRVRCFPPASEHRVIAEAVTELNADPRVTGIILQTPPSGSWQALTAAMLPEKDVDGWHPLNLGRLITNKRKRRLARGMEVVHLLKQAGVDLMGAHVICLGNASGLARVFALLCLHENATITMWKHASRWPDELMPRGDVLLIDTDEWPPVDGIGLKPGAVLIDARLPPHGQALALDSRWLEIVSLLIPLPGGVGPATVALRLSSLLALYRTQACIQSDA
jgi:methylenetetrahydrofolate dehydrogenase (NADP+)/methenyltetrahydrofolate cyclohydrolase